MSTAHKPSPMPTIKVMMTPFPYHITGGASLTEAAQLMSDKQIRHLVVTREDGSYGLLSERDLEHHQALYGGRGEAELSVADICREQAVCADINDPVDRVLNAMTSRHLGSVVVLRHAELAGIFTTSDACHHFAEHLRKEHSIDDSPDLIA